MSVMDFSSPSNKMLYRAVMITGAVLDKVLVLNDINAAVALNNVILKFHIC